MMETTYIYCLIDPRDNQPFYIGKTSRLNLKERLRGHCNEKGNNKKNCKIKKLFRLGLKPSIEKIDEVPSTEWEFWECHYIYLFRSWGFNLTNTENGGNGPGKLSVETKEKLRIINTGKKLSEETKRKISEFNKGKIGVKHSEETKRKISESRIGIGNPMYGKKGSLSHSFGKKLSEETKQKISKSRTGKGVGHIVTFETRNKISNARKGNPKCSGKNSPMYGKRLSIEAINKLKELNSKSVLQLSMDGEILNEYRSLKEAGMITHVPKTSISNCVRGRQKTAGGFKWILKQIFTSYGTK